MNFQTSEIIDLIMISTVKARFVHVELKMKHQFTSSYAARAIGRATLLSKISDIIQNDVSVLPDEYLSHILIYGSNIYNLVCNRLILAETLT